MARLHEAKAVLAAADRWKQECLLDGGSVFSDRDLWTKQYFEELKEEYVKKEKLAKGFWDSLKLQLQYASPDAQRLFAELVWVYYLVPNSAKAETKRKRIQQVWGWSGAELPYVEWAFDDVLRQGIIDLGSSAVDIAQDLSFFVEIMIDWCSRDRRGRQELLKVPWQLAKQLDERAGASKPPFRHLFLYLLFPDMFEPIVSRRDKARIIAGFFGKWNVETDLNDKSDPIQLDQALLNIRKRLEEDGTNGKTSFYHKPLTGYWRQNGAVSPEAAVNGRSLNTILYGPPGTGKTYSVAERCVEICDGPGENSPEEIRRRYLELVDQGRVEFVTFHQSYGYEEFVEGLRPQTGAADEEATRGSGFLLEPVDGVLKRLAERARKISEPSALPSDLRQGDADRIRQPEAPNENLPHVLVIDEINRANVSKVMGELVTLLEEDKREGAEHTVAVTLPHSRKPFTLPANLYIVGTMNTADRSIALLDTALRRRFEFEELAPDPGVLEVVDGIDLPNVLRAMNKRLDWLLGRDHLIGHAWLMKAKNKECIDRTMRRKIIPMLAEYFHEDWNKVRAVLGGTNDFVRREELKPPRGLDSGILDTRYRWSPVDPPYPPAAYVNLIGQADSGAENAED